MGRSRDGSPTGGPSRRSPNHSSWWVCGPAGTGVRSNCTEGSGRGSSDSRTSLSQWAPEQLCLAVWPIPESCYATRTKTRPLLDLGAGAIVRTGGRWLVRFDVGDSLVSYDVNLLNPPLIGTPDDPFVNNYPKPKDGVYDGTRWMPFFQAGVGVGFRF